MRSEQIDTRAVLNGNYGDANLTDPKVRIAERARVLDYWDPALISQVRDGFLVAPPWRLLVDPTRWSDVPKGDVHAFVYDAVNFGYWPTIDGLHRRFNRVSNHRGGAEVPAQESLLS